VECHVDLFNSHIYIVPHTYIYIYVYIYIYIIYFQTDTPSFHKHDISAALWYSGGFAYRVYSFIQLHTFRDQRAKPRLTKLLEEPQSQPALFRRECMLPIIVHVATRYPLHSRFANKCARRGLSTRFNRITNSRACLFTSQLCSTLHINRDYIEYTRHFRNEWSKRSSCSCGEHAPWNKISFETRELWYNRPAGSSLYSQSWQRWLSQFRKLRPKPFRSGGPQIRGLLSQTALIISGAGWRVLAELRRLQEATWPVRCARGKDIMKWEMIGEGDLEERSIIGVCTRSAISDWESSIKDTTILVFRPTRGGRWGLNGAAPFPEVAGVTPLWYIADRCSYTAAIRICVEAPPNCGPSILVHVFALPCTPIDE